MQASGATASYANGVLTVAGTDVGTGTQTSVGLTINAAPSGYRYAVSADASGHAQVSLAVAAPPTITGAAATKSTTGETALQPFAGITIGDSNTGATETLTITFTANGGPGGIFDGFRFSGTGSNIVTLTGTAAQVTSALDALTFRPGARNLKHRFDHHLHAERY